MKEIELRVLEINKKEISEKLESLGAKKKFEALQQRYVYDFKPKVPNKWIRLRTNGNTCTLTIKEVKSRTIDGTEELEIEVDDFKKTNLILNELGYVPKGYQENKRCQYILNGVEIDIDSWPYIPDYIEIEGKSIESVRTTLALLGFKDSDATSDDVEKIYEKYGYDLENIYELKLEEERK